MVVVVVFCCFVVVVVVVVVALLACLLSAFCIQLLYALVVKILFLRFNLNCCFCSLEFFFTLVTMAISFYILKSNLNIQTKQKKNEHRERKLIKNKMVYNALFRFFSHFSKCSLSLSLLALKKHT